MKWTTCATAAALTLATFSAGAAPATKGLIERSPDVLAPAQLKAKVAEKAALPLVPNIPQLRVAIGVAALLAVPSGLVNVANQSVLLQSAPVTYTASVGGIYRVAQFVGGGVAAAVLHLVRAEDVLPRLAPLIVAGAAVLIVTSVVAAVVNRRSARHRKVSAQ